MIASKAAKPIAKIPEARKHPHTRGDENGATFPPHSRARNSGTRHSVNRMVPRGSLLFSFSSRGRTFLTFAVVGTANHTKTRERNPMAETKC